MAEPRRYLAIVQDPRGYSREGLEETPPNGPHQPMIYSVVKTEDHDAEVARLQKAIGVAYAAMRGSEYVDGPSAREAWQTALGALGEVVTHHTAQGDGR